MAANWQTLYIILFGLEVSVCALTQNQSDSASPYINMAIDDEVRNHRIHQSCSSPDMQWDKSLVLRGQDIFSTSPQTFSLIDEESLLGLLIKIIDSEFEGCSLVITYENDFDGSFLLKGLLMAPNPRQVVRITKASDFHKIEWKSSLCRGYIFLQRNPQNLLTYANYEDYVWDFKGKFIIAGLSVANHMRQLSSSKKIFNTENVLGIVKGNQVGLWTIFTNKIVVNRGLSWITHWNINNFTVPRPILFPDKLDNLHRSSIRVGAFEYRPSVMCERDEDGTILDRYGRDVIIVEELVKLINATFVYVAIPQDQMWGYRAKNGTWDGLTGYLQKDKIDIGIGNMYISNVTFRMLVADFSAPFHVEVSAFLIRKPMPLPEWERIIYPFQAKTWIAIFIGLILTGPLLNLLARAGQASGGEKQDLISLSYSYLYSAGVLFMEGQAIVPRNRGVQIFIAFLWLYATIITTGYNSNLTALLTVARQPPTLDTFQQLYESELEIGGSGGIFKTSLARSVNRYLRGLSDRYVDYKSQIGQLAATVEEGKGVILQGLDYLRYIEAMYFNNEGISSVRVMRDTFLPFNVGIVTQRSSPLKRKLDHLIQLIVEAGLVRHWFHDSLIRAKKEDEAKKVKERMRANKKEGDKNKAMSEKIQEFASSKSVGEGVQALGFAHIQGFFFILFIGCFASTSAFFLEMIFPYIPE